MAEDYFNNLIKILRLTGGKYIIVENGIPKAVLMDYKDFEDLMIEKVAGDLSKRLSDIEAVNREITAAQMDELRAETDADAPRPETIRVEPIQDLDID